MSGKLKARSLALPVLVLGFFILILAGCGSRQAYAPPKVGPKDYVGSAECGKCHDQIFASWQQTLHSQVIQEINSENQNVVVGDFANPNDLVKFKREDAKIIHGVQWKQRYIDSQWRILPAQWNIDSNSWAPFNPDTWEKSDWRKQCAQCHVTGFRIAKGQDGKEEYNWKELSVGCEACHGPGGRHVTAKPAERAGTIVNPSTLPATLAADVCGQCHTRGKSPDGKLGAPVGFEPGMRLGPQHFKIVDKKDDKAWWPNGAVKMHRQQYPEWSESKHKLAGVTCTTCHTVHGSSTKFATKLAPNNLCQSCHSGISTDSVTGHAPIAGAPQHSNCVACHMAPTGKSADVGDERVHTFKVIKPQVTVDLGGGDPKKQPNSCNSCHYHDKDDPARLQKALDDGRKR